MSYIVDDAGNLQEFTAAVTNVLASFTQRQDYGHPAQGETHNSNASIVQPQSATAPATNSRAYTPGSPSTPPPPYTAQGVRETSSVVLPSRGVNQATSQTIDTIDDYPSLATHDDRKPDKHEAQFKAMDNGISVKQGRAINKHLDSPQLTGLRAPPPTPETWAHKTPLTGSYNDNRLGDDLLEEELAKEDLLISHITKQMTNKPAHTGLGESMYAYRRPSYLADEAGHTPNMYSVRDVSPTSRREREKSFERLSFVVASASKSELLSKINAQSMLKSDISSLREAVISPKAAKDNEEVTLQPPKLRVTVPSSVRDQTAKDKQAHVDTMKIAPALIPTLGPGQPVNMKQAHATLEAIAPVLASIPAPGQSAKGERAHVGTEKNLAVLSPSSVPEQPAKSERVHKNPDKVAAEPPIVAFKAGLLTFLDKYGARNKVATPKLDPETSERAVTPTAKPPQYSVPAEKNEATIEFLSLNKWNYAVDSDLIQLHQPESAIESTHTVNDKPNLPPILKVNSKVPGDTGNTEPFSTPANAVNLRRSTPLRAIAVSQKDIPLTGKDKIHGVPSTTLRTLTPVSGNFEDLSPRTARYVLRPQARNSAVDKSQSTDDTYTTYLGHYPQPERRDKPGTHSYHFI